MKSVYLILAFTTALYSSISQAGDLSREEAIVIIHNDVKALAERRANLFEPDNLIADAAVEALQVPEEATQPENNLAMITGCRPHSCDEKSAALIDVSNRRLIAIGIKNYQCHYVLLGGESNGGTRKSPIVCEREPLLSIYVVRRKGLSKFNDEEKAVHHLLEWGKRVGVSRSSLYVTEDR